MKKQTVKDSYPLTNIQEILHSLQGATVFSSLDACGAYHAVRIEPHLLVWNVPVHQDAFPIGQRGECVQQDTGHSHEGRGQGLLEILPR